MSLATWGPHFSRCVVNVACADLVERVKWTISPSPMLQSSSKDALPIPIQTLASLQPHPKAGFIPPTIWRSFEDHDQKETHRAPSDQSGSYIHVGEGYAVTWAATSALGAEAIGTRWKLKEPGLILAPDVELAPKNKVSGDVLEMMASLAHAVDVTFHLLPGTMSPSQA